MDKANIGLIGELQRILLHINSMGNLLVSHHTELIDTKQLSPNLGYPSEPILTIADIIEEKSEICLDKLQILEVYFREVDERQIDA